MHGPMLQLLTKMAKTLGFHDRDIKQALNIFIKQQPENKDLYARVKAFKTRESIATF